LDFGIYPPLVVPKIETLLEEERLPLSELFCGIIGLKQPQLHLALFDTDTKEYE
jgi:hypothetical protein